MTYCAYKNKHVLSLEVTSCQRGTNENIFRVMEASDWNLDQKLRIDIKV